MREVWNIQRTLILQYVVPIFRSDDKSIGTWRSALAFFFLQHFVVTLISIVPARRIVLYVHAVNLLLFARQELSEQTASRFVYRRVIIPQNAIPRYNYQPT